MSILRCGVASFPGHSSAARSCEDKIWEWPGNRANSGGGLCERLGV